MMERQGKERAESLGNDRRRLGQVTAAYAAFANRMYLRSLDEAVARNWSRKSEACRYPILPCHASRAYGLIDKEATRIFPLPWFSRNRTALGPLWFTTSLERPVP